MTATHVISSFFKLIIYLLVHSFFGGWGSVFLVLMSSLWMDLKLQAVSMCACQCVRECEDDERSTGMHNR